MATQQAPDAGSGSGVPTCYRHAGRETYLSCTRCGRAACPDCLRSAPVGQQCVECIKEGNRGARTPTTVFGGRAVSGALVTYTLVRSEEHTSELQSQFHLVCRLLLEKKKQYESRP